MLLRLSCHDNDDSGPTACLTHVHLAAMRASQLGLYSSTFSRQQLSALMPVCTLQHPKDIRLGAHVASRQRTRKTVSNVESETERGKARMK